MSRKQRILERNKVNTRKEYVEEWDETVLIRGLDARFHIKAARFPKDANGQRDLQHFNEEVFLAGVRDPDTGAPLFTREDIPELLDGNGRAFERLLAGVLDLSALSAGSIEKAKKRFLESQLGDSSSSSPSDLDVQSKNSSPEESESSQPGN